MTFEALSEAEASLAFARRVLTAADARLKAAEAEYLRASADLILAGRLDEVIAGMHNLAGICKTEGAPTVEVVGELPERAPEGPAILLTQDRPTKRDARTGVESGTVIAVVVGSLDARNLGTVLPSLAGARGMLIKGARGPVLGQRSGVQVFPAGGRASVYKIHVDSAMPEVPVLADSDLERDAERWATSLAGRIDRRAGWTTKVGSNFPMVKDVRSLVRSVSASESTTGDKVNRALVATGQVTIRRGESFEALREHVVSPMVARIVSSPVISDLAPGLGLPVSLAVDIEPVSDFLADLTIRAKFLSAAA